MLVILFWIPWIYKYIINEDDDKFITADMRKPMHQFDNILRACIDEIIIFDFCSDLPSKVNIFTYMGLKATLHYATTS